MTTSFEASAGGDAGLRERLARSSDRTASDALPGVDEQVHEQGRRRLAFEELLLGQLALQQLRRARRTTCGGAADGDGPRNLTARWLDEALPFALTGDQVTAIEALDADLARSEPMQRLLMGEVGSGKTVVALYAMLRAVEHDLQAALMAPTETLAEQHFQTLQKLLGSENVRLGLLTGSTPTRRRADLLSKLATGELSLIVGTHALIEEAVVFNRLGGRGGRRAAPLRRRAARGAPPQSLRASTRTCCT